MALKIIAAMTMNRVIGKDGDLPFDLPDDRVRFRNITTGKPVVIGRKTFRSLPDRFRPLLQRENIVLTRDRYNAISDHANVTFEHDFDTIIARGNREDLWVIGGAEIYALALPNVDEMFLTRVQAVVRGDVFFPPWDSSQWSLISQEFVPANNKNKYSFTWEVWRRI